MDETSTRRMSMPLQILWRLATPGFPLLFLCAISVCRDFLGAALSLEFRPPPLSADSLRNGSRVYQCHAFAYPHQLNSLSEGPPCSIFKLVGLGLLCNFAPFQTLDSLSAIGPCPFEKSTFSWFSKRLGFPLGNTHTRSNPEFLVIGTRKSDLNSES